MVEIYIRGIKMTSISRLLEEPEPENPDSLPDLIELSSELQNSIKHLESSNEQLNEALTVEYDDCIYQAIVENEYILSKKKSRLEVVQGLINKKVPQERTNHLNDQ